MLRLSLSLFNIGEIGRHLAVPVEQPNKVHFGKGREAARRAQRRPVTRLSPSVHVVPYRLSQTVRRLHFRE